MEHLSSPISPKLSQINEAYSKTRKRIISEVKDKETLNNLFYVKFPLDMHMQLDDLNETEDIESYVFSAFVDNNALYVILDVCVDPSFVHVNGIIEGNVSCDILNRMGEPIGSIYSSDYNKVSLVDNFQEYATSCYCIKIEPISRS